MKKKPLNQLPPSTDSGFLGMLFGFSALVMIAVSPLFKVLAAGKIRCVFKTLTGFPCPTCGATRSAVSLSSFDLPGAFHLNPLFALTSLSLIMWGLVSLVAYLQKKRFDVPYSRRFFTFIRIFIPLAVLANWIYLTVTL